MSLIDALRHRAYVLLNSDRYEDEQAEELTFHTEMTRMTSPNATSSGPNFGSPGHGPRGRASLGDALRSVFDAFRQDLGHSLRGVRRAPGFAALVVATLALGVGANAAMFSVLTNIFGAPAGLEDPGSLRRLYLTTSGATSDRWSPNIMYARYELVRDAVEGSGSVASWIPSVERTLTRGDASQSVQVAWVSPDFFPILGVKPAIGRVFGEDESRIDVPSDVAVVSHAFWTKELGADPAVLGRSLTLNDTLTYTVVGVAAVGFSGLDLGETDVFLPLSAYRAATGGRPWYLGAVGSLNLIARLAQASGEHVLSERATTGYRRQPAAGVLVGEADTSDVIRAGPLAAALGPARQDAAVPITTRAAGVALLVLLIACANLATLLLVRAESRRREIAVRLALGVGRLRLLSQLLTESLPLALVAGLGAWLLGAWGGVALLRLILPDVSWADPEVELQVLLGAVVVATLTALLAGLAPGLQALRVVPDAVLKSRGSAARSVRSWGRSGLLVVQIAFSGVLLVGAGLFARSLGRLDALPLGYDVDQLVLASVASDHFRSDRAASSAAVSAVAADLETLDGVIGAARSNQLPMNALPSVSVMLTPESESEPEPEEFRASMLSVSPEFFTVTGVRIVQGRTFDAGERGVAVVDETMAALLWPGEPPLGRCIYAYGFSACSEVVGVSSDARSRQIVEDPTPQFFLPLNVNRDAQAITVRVSGDLDRVASVLMAELGKSFDPRFITVETMADRLAPQLRPWKLGAQLFTAFGLLALLVTAVGVYSVMAYTMSQRTHEMGVRIALGAKVLDVLRLVVGNGLRVILLGAVVGIALTFALGKLIASLLYGVTPQDPVAMGSAVAVLLIAGLVASLVPAWRAARVDPVRALAAE